MAQYKVPQDVEADDKLLGPFSFRQFVYLLIAAGSIGLAIALFQIFPILAIIPVPFILFFAVLALPLRRDQPMETYLAAIISFYFKPRRRIWMPGQRESTIVITAPKVVEQSRTRNLSEEEASRRLSFLANIVDSEGLAIRNSTIDFDESAPAFLSNVQEDIVAEANSATDIFDTNSSANIGNMIERRQADRRNQIMNAMHAATENIDAISAITTPSIQATPPQATQLATPLDQSQLTMSQILPSQPNPIQSPSPQPNPPQTTIQPNATTSIPPATSPQPQPTASYHDLQLDEMRQVIAKTEAMHGTANNSLPNHVEITPLESTAPDYSAAIDALLHSENANPTSPSSTNTPTQITPTPTVSPPTPTSSLDTISQTPSPLPPSIIMPPTSTTSTTTPQTPTTPATTSSPNPSSAPPTRKVPSARFVNLASNQDYTIATIQKEADRISKADEEQEVFISLH